jgi:UDP-N-acetylmuramoylalanine--D-glutamate ligase
MIEMEFNSLKKILLIGAGGKTGFWYCRLLLKDGFEVFAYDQNPQVKFDPELLSSNFFHIVSQIDFENFEILKSIDSVTFSPGVYLKQPVILEAMKLNKKTFSELEYCFEKLRDRTWICVTGTDGKSTTVSLIEHCLNQFQANSISCGNIGLPFSRLLFEYEKFKKYEILVAELSSYQLELCRNLKTDIAVFLNLAPDHLNRYSDLEDYGLAKWNVVLSVKENGLSLINNSLSPSETPLWEKNHPLNKISIRSKIIFIDSKNLHSKNFILENNFFIFKKTNEKIVHQEKLQIQGAHNYSNTLFALEVLHYFSYNNIEKIASALESFKSLPHRFERIDIGDGNIYINDSKATTTQAAIIAIKNSPNPLFVFIGGRSKGEDYTDLANALKIHPGDVFIYGENKTELSNVFKQVGCPVTGISETLESAFKLAIAWQKSRQISNVTYLLSPASTSWDQYSSFEQRGDDFKKIVAGLVT